MRNILDVLPYGDCEADIVVTDGKNYCSTFMHPLEVIKGEQWDYPIHLILIQSVVVLDAEDFSPHVCAVESWGAYACEVEGVLDAEGLIWVGELAFDLEHPLGESAAAGAFLRIRCMSSSLFKRGKKI